MKQTNILIVGGTGFIGYHLAKSALAKKLNVVSFSTKPPIKIRKLKKVKYILGDIGKKKDLNKLKKNFTYVVNLGGYVDHSNKKKTFQSHFVGCKNLSDFFLKKKIKSFIQIGSCLEYGFSKSPQKENFKCRPNSIYAKSKYLSSSYVIDLYKKKSFPSTVIRLYQVYGSHQDKNRLIPIVIDSCIKNKKFPCSNGKQFRDFIHVNDIVKGIFKCMKKEKAKGEIINLGQGSPIKVIKIINTIKNESKGGFPEFGKINLRKEESLKLYPSIIKAKKILDWKPKLNFYIQIKKVIKFYKKYDRS